MRKFKDMVELGVQQFKGIFEEHIGSNIAEIIKFLFYFPRLVPKEYNASVFRVVTKEELLHVISTFKKDRSLGHDGWIVDFFIRLL